MEMKLEITVMKKFKTIQGDVGIYEIDSIPKSAKLLDTKTIMYGEQTGHHHTFSEQVMVYEPTNNDIMEVRDRDKVLIQKYVYLQKGTQLVHQEHATQVIPKGTYAILQEREWDVLENQIRAVMD